MDKVSELYDIIHFFRIGIESQGELIEDKRKAVLKFFGIWKDMSPEESSIKGDQFKATDKLNGLNAAISFKEVLIWERRL